MPLIIYKLNTYIYLLNVYIPIAVVEYQLCKHKFKNS